MGAALVRDADVSGHRFGVRGGGVFAGAPASASFGRAREIAARAGCSRRRGLHDVGVDQLGTLDRRLGDAGPQCRPPRWRGGLSAARRQRLSRNGMHLACGTFRLRVPSRRDSGTLLGEGHRHHSGHQHAVQRIQLDARGSCVRRHDRARRRHAPRPGHAYVVPPEAIPPDPEPPRLEGRASFAQWVERSPLITAVFVLWVSFGSRCGFARRARPAST